MRTTVHPRWTGISGTHVACPRCHEPTRVIPAEWWWDPQMSQWRCRRFTCVRNHYRHGLQEVPEVWREAPERDAPVVAETADHFDYLSFTLKELGLIDDVAS